ncbi:MAG TPA: hypothetical protein VFW70_16875, partial [Methylomirabilota bacterium]|nr:hypothetical protein [Methylomirabilota bacterium]
VAGSSARAGVAGTTPVRPSAATRARDHTLHIVVSDAIRYCTHRASAATSGAQGDGVEIFPLDGFGPAHQILLVEESDCVETLAGFARA